MKKRTNSKALLIEQVKRHTEVLCETLTSAPNAPVPSLTMENIILGTRMLTGTFDLMGMLPWGKVLGAFEALLHQYHEKERDWDDEIAQVVSEVVEKEEMLACFHEADPTGDLNQAVEDTLLTALLTEIMIFSEPGAEPPPQAEEAASSPSRVVQEFNQTASQLQERLGSADWLERERSNPDADGVRRNLHILDFYIRTIDQSITAGQEIPAVNYCDLKPVELALQDFARSKSQEGERSVEIRLSAPDCQVDPKLLFRACSVVQRMITDVYHRCEAPSLVVNVKVENEHGALHWHLSDDASSFASESRLDHEDLLAFYPGLRVVRGIVADMQGAMWVEPGDAQETRFAFTMPMSQEHEPFLVWNGEQPFAIRAQQLCASEQTLRLQPGHDSMGEYLTVDGRRVPLLRLNALFSKAPSDGEEVVVIGSLERRIAFYVPRDAQAVTGQTLQGSISMWEGPPQAVIRIHGGRVPLVDADQLLEGYLRFTGALSAEDISGGVAENETDLIQSQAASVSDAGSSPVGLQPPDALAVVVVEQSESMRTALTDIFTQSNIKATFVEGTEEAIELIHRCNPRLVISEFRMPSMAAKVLVESLRNQGSDIPVLVTTSRFGKNADLLVEKLGVDGYLTKPLAYEAVTDRIKGYLKEGAIR